MERKLGEVFTCNGKLYQVVKGFSCNGCAFIKDGNCYLDDKLLGPCAYTERTDKTSVIFKLINNMERKIGEIFTYKGKTYQVVKSDTCRDCAFFSTRCNSLQTLVTGTCTPGGRKDNINVAFKEINNIENNQLTIDIPEGMEIDLENSDLAKGIIKFKNDNITLEDIYKDDNTDYAANLVILSENKLFNKLLCIARLIDIANYYNKGWKPDFNNKTTYKYVIQYNGIENKHTHYSVDYDVCLNRCCVYFKNQEDAQSVIDNPNFRSILDTIYKD